MSGHTTETAPKRVWLQVNPDAMVDDETGGVEGDDEPFPGEEVTWCQHSTGGLEVEYVRADLVSALIEKWRADSSFYAHGAEPDKSVVYDRCANELEMALSGANTRIEPARSR